MHASGIDIADDATHRPSPHHTSASGSDHRSCGIGNILAVMVIVNHLERERMQREGGYDVIVAISHISAQVLGIAALRGYNDQLAQIVMCTRRARHLYDDADSRSHTSSSSRIASALVVLFLAGPVTPRRPHVDGIISPVIVVGTSRCDCRISPNLSHRSTTLSWSPWTTARPIPEACLAHLYYEPAPLSNRQLTFYADINLNR